METGLAVIQATHAAIRSAESVVNIYRKTKSVRKQEVIRMREEARVATHVCRANGAGMVLMASLDQLAQASSFLEQHDMGEELRAYSISLIDTLVQGLRSNLRHYSNSCAI